MVAVAAEQVIRRPMEILGDLFDDGLDFMIRSECEALQKLTSKRSPGRFLAWPCPIYPGRSGSIMSSERVFPVQAFDYHAGV